LIDLIENRLDILHPFVLDVEYLFVHVLHEAHRAALEPDGVAKGILEL